MSGERKDRFDFSTQLHTPSPLVPYSVPSNFTTCPLLSCLQDSQVRQCGSPRHVVCPHHLFSPAPHLFTCCFTLQVVAHSLIQGTNRTVIKQKAPRHKHDKRKREEKKIKKKAAEKFSKIILFQWYRAIFDLKQRKVDDFNRVSPKSSVLLFPPEKNNNPILLTYFFIPIF